MRYALFYNRTNGTAVVTAAPAHAVAGGIEAEDIDVAGTALEGRRAPVVAVLSNVVRRRPETTAGSGKEDGFAVLTGYFVAVMTALHSPRPSTLVYEFLALCFGRKSP